MLQPKIADSRAEVNLIMTSFVSALSMIAHVKDIRTFIYVYTYT